jgi:hypothetical protein
MLESCFMKRILMMTVLLSVALISFSQTDSLEVDKKKKNRYVAWLIPSAATNIYGIAIGPVGSEAICNRPYTKYSHGLNIQIPGQGFFQTFYINSGSGKHLYTRKEQDLAVPSADTILKKAVHNGILISPLGTFTDQVNGASFSLWMSLGKKINGISFNLLWNLYDKINGVSVGLVNHTGTTKGVQIGFVNKTAKLRGFQFGLWNKNEKRSLPLINWNFRN